MQTRRAVLATLDAARASTLKALLAEAGYAAAAMASSAPEAFDAVRAVEPDLLLADGILPGGDGEWLAERVLTAGLNRYPDVALMFPAGFRLPDADRLRALGVERLEEPVSQTGLTSALNRFAGRAGTLPPAKAAKLADVLARLGVPPHPGRDMLARATALCWRDRRRLRCLKRDVYPESGRPFGRTGAQAERAMRHVIQAAWRTGDMAEQQRLFGDTIDERRGHPTSSEMIAQLSDILRWEGRP